MRFGYTVPQYGAFADPEFIRQASTDLESMGYDSLWAGDRILLPLTPSDPYPGGDGTVPLAFGTFFDPLTALTLAAVSTREIRLGTSTLNALWQPPVLLARTLTSLDLLSHGRLDVGIGLGWLRDEYTATGVPWRGRGDRLEETLDVMEAVWTGEVVEHKGALWTVPPSHIDLKPCQRPRPPILLAGYTPPALERVGRRADGWLSAAMPMAYLTSLWDLALEAASRAGRDPSALRMVVRVNPEITDSPAPADQVPHAGTVRQVADYLLTLAAAGAHEAFVDLQTASSSREQFLDVAHALVTMLRAG
ncbi:TIGR03619 family F420-dependent LLM class oxidoreductase [Microbispora bryophytorum]|uniref:TIGR03619 family F420-dependent LLM class oxidoreductase n=1 Tax=Microbispora bryophytorum subsp. camponoti TaxID=1677852 RepID=A0ABR8LDG5_9ACTN|nr:TIGR03619 family F420-dependent LLM class oxidoreductase [Microbispora camponoti]MBD3146558.1 TIGR03619 family F420-dependent LLM class oxidoreductase [Microbispora camponoti]